MTIHKRHGLLFLILVVTAAHPPIAARGATEIRVACVGDSITAGALLEDSEHDAYPAVLGRLLGADYYVGNFGASGATLLKQGDTSYWKDDAFRAASEFGPQIAIIKLGTNDSKPVNWDTHAREFAADAAALIEHFADLPSRPAVWVCLPIPAYPSPYGVDERNLSVIRRELREVAAARGARVIDTYAALQGKPNLLVDGVHPTPAGAELLAQTIAAALTEPSPGLVGRQR